MNTFGAFRCLGVRDLWEPVWCVIWGYWTAVSRDGCSSLQKTVGAPHFIPCSPFKPIQQSLLGTVYKLALNNIIFFCIFLYF